jgi:hypothetical protein
VYKGRQFCPRENYIFVHERNAFVWNALAFPFFRPRIPREMEKTQINHELRNDSLVSEMERQYRRAQLGAFHSSLSVSAQTHTPTYLRKKVLRVSGKLEPGVVGEQRVPVVSRVEFAISSAGASFVD